MILVRILRFNKTILPNLRTHGTWGLIPTYVKKLMFFSLSICHRILAIAQFPAQPEVLINVETAGNIFLKLSPDLHMIVLLTQFIILITKNNFLCHF